MIGIETVVDSVGSRLPWEARGDGEEPVETRPGVVFDEERVLSGEERTLTSTELLSDEERVLEAIRAARGRIWQSTLCEDFGWDESKVSRLLTRLDEDGKLSKYRVGRRNVICLPGHGPELGRIETAARTEND